MENALNFGYQKFMKHQNLKLYKNRQIIQIKPKMDQYQYQYQHQHHLVRQVRQAPIVSDDIKVHYVSVHLYHHLVLSFGSITATNFYIRKRVVMDISIPAPMAE